MDTGVLDLDQQLWHPMHNRAECHSNCSLRIAAEYQLLGITGEEVVALMSGLQVSYRQLVDQSENRMVNSIGLWFDPT